jgi:phosphinothricin acetyltransferase
VRIREADPSRDAPACAAIYGPYVRDTPISFEEAPPTGAELERRMREILRVYPWLVAERDGAAAGFAYASPHRTRSAYRWAADVSVYVDPAHHREGVGRALYARLFELLRTQNLLIACAGITLPNPASVALHEALGFEPVGIYRRIGYKHGAWRDVGWWQLALAEQPIPPPEPTGRGLPVPPVSGT